MKPKSGGYADLFERDLDTDSTELLISYPSFPQTFVWPVEAVKPSPDGKYLALIESVNVFSGGGRCWVWERKTGRVSKVSDDSLGSAGFDWLPEGKRLLVHDDAGGLYFDGPYNGSIAFYDAATHKLSKLGPVKGLVLAVPASKSSNVIEVLSIKGDKSSVYMQPSVGERKLLFQWSGLIFSIIQSPDSSRFVFFDFHNYYVTDTRGRNARKFKIPAVNENLRTTFKFNKSGTRVGVFTEYSTGEPHVNKTQQLWVADVRSGHAWRIAKWEELFQGRDLAIARTLAPKTWPITFDTSYFGGIEMCYAMQPTGKSSTPMILFYGADQNWEEKTVLLAAANPVKATAGRMKRAHSIAQGKPNHYRLTGSRVQNASFSNGRIRNSSGQWVTWTGDLTSEQGAYPWPSSIVTWAIPSGQEYYTENSINIDL